MGDTRFKSLVISGMRIIIGMLVHMCVYEPDKKIQTSIVEWAADAENYLIKRGPK